MLRRLHPEQPESFAFTPENRAWAEAQITKYPEGRQASAVIPLLWRAQEQEGWLTRPAIEEVGRMLGMAYIRVLEVATFYFMFHLQPVGRVAHVQVCGTTSCMICGAEDLIAVCRERIAPRGHQVSADGKFSWEEVECLGACANAPMIQIGKDYYEDLTAESFAALLDRFAAGEVPVPGSGKGRFASEPASGLTSLEPGGDGAPEHNAAVALALELEDTVKRIDGTEVPLVTPWRRAGTAGLEPPRQRDDLLPPTADVDHETPGPKPGEDTPVDDTGSMKQQAPDKSKGWPDEGGVAPESHGDGVPPEGGHAGEKNEPEPDPGQGRSASVSGEGPLESQGKRRGRRPAGKKDGGKT